MILFNVMTSPGPEQPRLSPLTDISVIVSTPLQPRQLSDRPPHYVQAEAEWHVSNASRAIISMVFGIQQLKLLGYSHFSLHSYNRSTSQMMKLTWKIHWISQTHRQQFWEFQRGMLFWRIDEDDQVIFHRFYQTELSASIIFKMIFNRIYGKNSLFL